MERDSGMLPGHVPLSYLREIQGDPSLHLKHLFVYSSTFQVHSSVLDPSFCLWLLTCRALHCDFTFLSSQNTCGLKGSKVMSFGICHSRRDGIYVLNSPEKSHPFG